MNKIEIYDAIKYAFLNNKENQIIGLKGMASTIDQKNPIAFGFMTKSSKELFNKVEIEIGLKFNSQVDLQKIKTIDDLKAITNAKIYLEFLNAHNLDFVSTIKNNGFFSKHYELTRIENFDKLKVNFLDALNSAENDTLPYGTVKRLKNSCPYFVALEMINTLKEIKVFDTVPKDFIIITGSLVVPIAKTTGKLIVQVNDKEFEVSL